MKIPKIIHQTAQSWESLCPEIINNINHLKRLNIGYEYRFYDESDRILFIRENYGDEELAAYELISDKYGVAKADLFRYLLIYKLGGVYLDIKSSVSVPLDELIRNEDTIILSRWNNGWGAWPQFKVESELQQWHIISEAKNPLILLVIRDVIDNIIAYNFLKDGVGKIGVLKSTGPIAYTLAIQKGIDSFPHRFFDAEADGLVYSIFPSNCNHSVKISGHDYRDSLDPLVKSNLVVIILARIYFFLIKKRKKLTKSLLKRLR